VCFYGTGTYGIHQKIRLNVRDDARKILTVDDRKGNYPGMLKTRIFNLAIAGEKSINGVEINAVGVKSIPYGGKRQTVSFIK